MKDWLKEYSIKAIFLLLFALVAILWTRFLFDLKFDCPPNDKLPGFTIEQ